MGKKNKNKKPSQEKIISSKKKPRLAFNPDSWMSKTPVWVFSLHDRDHEKWSCKHCEDFYKKIITKLAAFEGMTWGNILKQTHDGGKSSNHFIDVDKLSKEAKQRLDDLKIREDQLLSLRLNNKIRLFGIIEDGVFSILWYDEDHKIYPYQKKHT